VLPTNVQSTSQQTSDALRLWNSRNAMFSYEIVNTITYTINAIESECSASASALWDNSEMLYNINININAIATSELCNAQSGSLRQCRRV